jgi:hypothetical protein
MRNFNPPPGRLYGLCFMFLLASTTIALAGYLPLLKAGLGAGGGGPVIPSFVLQTDDVSYILLVDGVSKLLKAQP